MRVVSWNIEWFNNQREIAGTLKRLNPDVCLLYELDLQPGPSEIDTFSVIKSALGYEGRLIEEFPANRPKMPGTGNAIFSRYPIKTYASVDLPPEKPSLLHPQTYAYQALLSRRFGGSRKAQVFSIDAEDRTLTIVAAHLELLTSGWKHRRAQLQAAVAAAPARPDIIAGDFNNVQGSLLSAMRGRPRTNSEIPKVRKWLADQSWQDPFKNSDVTAGKYGMQGKIDWLAADESLTVTGARTKWTNASDHAYLVVDYDLGKAER